MRPLKFKGKQNRHGRKVEKIWRTYLDKCQVCHGKRGGCRGNENVVNGIIMCDYCSVEYDNEN